MNFVLDRLDEIILITAAGWKHASAERGGGGCKRVATGAMSRSVCRDLELQIYGSVSRDLELQVDKPLGREPGLQVYEHVVPMAPGIKCIVSSQMAPVSRRMLWGWEKGGGGTGPPCYWRITTRVANRSPDFCPCKSPIPILLLRRP